MAGRRTGLHHRGRRAGSGARARFRRILASAWSDGRFDRPAPGPGSRRGGRSTTMNRRSTARRSSRSNAIAAASRRPSRPPSWQGLNDPRRMGANARSATASTSRSRSGPPRPGFSDTWKWRSAVPGRIWPGLRRPASLVLSNPGMSTRRRCPTTAASPPRSLRSLVTQPVPGTSPPELEPVLYPIPGPAHIERCYLEMVQPNDRARRIVGDPATESDPPDHRQFDALRTLRA